MVSYTTCFSDGGDIAYPLMVRSVVTSVARTSSSADGKVGVGYEYRPQAIRSIGDLRCRRSPSSSYNAAFWDRESITFEAVDVPDWLTIESASGLIVGTPGKAGTHTIVFDVSAGKGKTSTVTQQIRLVRP